MHDKVGDILTPEQYKEVRHISDHREADANFLDLYAAVCLIPISPFLDPEGLTYFVHHAEGLTLPQVEELGILVDRDDQVIPQSSHHPLVDLVIRFSIVAEVVRNVMSIMQRSAEAGGIVPCHTDSGNLCAGRAAANIHPASL